MISIHKKYRYSNGEEAQILTVCSNYPGLPVISLAQNGMVYYHKQDGTYSLSNRDLVI